MILTIAATPAFWTIGAGGGVHAEAEVMSVVGQTFNVALGGTASFTVDLPTDVTPELAQAAEFQITSYERADAANDITAALEGDLPRAVDVAELDPAAITLSADGDEATLTVVIEAENRSPDTLQFSRPGVYPVQIELFAGEISATALTFVNRLDASADAPDATNVAVAMYSGASVSLDSTGDSRLTGGSLDELARLADTLVAAVLPVGVTVDPSAVVTASNNDPGLVARLAQAFSPHLAVSAPAPPLDATAAADAGATDVYTQWLRAGEDTLGGALGSTAKRSVTLAPSMPTTPAATMLRDLGSRLLVVTPEAYDSTEGSLGGFTDTSQLVAVELADGARLPTAVVDRTVAALLADAERPVNERVVASTSVVLAARQGVVDRGGDPSRHTTVIALPDLSVPDADLLGPLTQLISSTPGITPIDLDAVVDRTESLLFDGRPVVVALAGAGPSSVGARVETRDRLDAEAVSTATMLVDEPDVLRDWQRRSSLLPSTAMADADAVTLEATLSAEYRSVRDAVELPAPVSFTITGDESSIPLRFTNTSARPLTIRVRLIAPRLIVPGGDTTVVLAPNDVTTLDVPVRTRANGRSPVSLDVFTPDGAIQIGERVPLSVRVTNLAGLGNLVTGAAVLILLTWWGRHWWRNRGDGDDDDGSADEPDDGLGGLSPDAAASTLPGS